MNAMEEMDNIDILKTRNIELEEELKICKQDLIKKDEHIKALSSMEIRRSSSQVSESIETRAELSQLQIQLEYANKRLEEKHGDIERKEEENKKLIEEMGVLKEKENELVNEMCVLREELGRMGEKKEEYEYNCKRSAVAIEALQAQVNESTDRIVQLEQEVMQLHEANVVVDKSRSELASNITVFYQEVTEYLGMEGDSGVDLVLDRIKNLIGENNLIQGELSNLKKEMVNREDRYLESRETLRKLTEEFGTDKDSMEGLIRQKRELKLDVEQLRLDKIKLKGKKKDWKMKAKELEEKLCDVHRVLDEKEAILCKFELEKRESSYTSRNMSREVELFKETLAGILGNSLSYCEAGEQQIKERIKRLMSESKEKDNNIKCLEERLRNMSVQYEKNYENVKESDMKARRTELEYFDLKERIKLLEKELSKKDVSADELRSEKEKFYHFIRRLASLMKMDPYTRDQNLSLIFDGVLDRVDHLCSHEASRNIDTDKTILGLRRRVKDLKDQVHSRDVHLELMRKKIVNQTNELREAFSEVDQTKQVMEGEEEVKNKLGRMQRKMESLRDENKALKCEVFDLSDMRQKYMDQVKEIETLQHNLTKLERVRQRQATKIGQLAQTVECVEGNVEQTKHVSDTAVNSITNELRVTKAGLDRARTSEKELLDFRCVVARILGLNVEDLAIPNYDIIRRLEKLVSLPPSGVTVAMPIQHCPIKTGYQDRLLGRKRCNPRRPVSKYNESTRPRSVSPPHYDTNSRDARKY